MAWFVVQSLVMILLAFLVGLLVGWLWWGRRRGLLGSNATVVAAQAPAELMPAELMPVDPAPQPEPEPAMAEPLPAPIGELAAVRTPDDLERIEGIGPKMAAALRAADILAYRELADSDVPRLRAAIEAAGLSFAPSLTTWARQARLLADGDEEGFADLTRRLVAGRDVGR